MYSNNVLINITFPIPDGYELIGYNKIPTFFKYFTIWRLESKVYM